MIGLVSVERAELLGQLERLYRGHGWLVNHDEDGTLCAAGPGGVTWLGTAVVPEDLASDRLESKLLDLAGRRMPKGGELCPLDVLPAPECEAELRQLLTSIGLDRRPHVSVYSLPDSLAA